MRAAPQHGGDAAAVFTVTAGAFPSNCHVCIAGGPGQCFLIDPGLDGAAIDRELKARGLTPRHVFCTHGHFDHAGSAAFFQKKYGAAVHLHEADLKTLKTSNFLLMAVKIPQRIELPEVTPIEDDFAISIGDATLRYHHAPGHTPGSCIIAFGAALFTGDTIYRSGVGLSKLPGEDPDLLRASIRRLWDTLPGAATTYPGHGSAASFASIRENNGALRAFLGLPQPDGEGRAA
jgi:hydroxyacylglutathione hydrolase